MRADECRHGRTRATCPYCQARISPRDFYEMRRFLNDRRKRPPSTRKQKR